MRYCYVPKTFTDEAYLAIHHTEQVCRTYAAQGLDLTLRQVYYQFVSRDWFPEDRTWSQTASGKWVRDPNGTKNAEPNYKWLGTVLNDARLAGLLDWDYIVDRTRNLRSLAHWSDPEQLVSAAARQFRMDKWDAQDTRVEVWIEKDALVGILESVCPRLDVDYFSCRGYTSQSEVWGAAQRLGSYIENGKKAVILHLGDHDPSGIDMTRDIHERLALFIAQDQALMDVKGRGAENQDYVDALEGDLIVERIALNMDQIRHYNPPPNPAKLSDSRGSGYVRKYGNSSWELDALDPPVLVDLIEKGVARHRDDRVWEESVKAEEAERKALTAASERWGDVKTFLEEVA